MIEIPIFEYLCDNCGHYEEKLEFGDEIDKEHICPKCKGSMDKLISKTLFKLIYNNKKDLCDWEGNSSHYWDAYRAAKERGEDVKPADED